MTVTPVEISQLWRHANRQMRSLFRSTAQEYDLPPFSFFLLRHIEENPGITLSKLARRVGASKSHTSTMVEQLEKEGYVDKRSDPADQRVIRLHLTAAATRRFEGMGEHARDVWAVVLQELSEGEIEDVGRLLRTLTAALERANARIQSAEASDAAPVASEPSSRPLEVHGR